MSARPGLHAGSRIFAAPLLWLSIAAGAAASTPAEGIERGRYLVHAGGCISCHTADRPEAIPLAGGRRLETPFGVFYSPNLTPDRKTGGASMRNGALGSTGNLGSGSPLDVHTLRSGRTVPS